MLIKGAAAAGAIAAALALTGCGSTVSSTTAPVVTNLNASGNFVGDEITPAFEAPQGAFAASTGGTYDLSDHMTGRVTLLYFGYTHCPDVCPTTMADLGIALRSLPTKTADDVRVVFITSDPADDTPAVMRKWLSSFDSGLPAFLGLRTGLKPVQAYAAKVGVQLDDPQTDAAGDVTDVHAAQVLAFSPDGKAHLVWTPGTTSEQYAADITKLVAGVT